MGSISKLDNGRWLARYKDADRRNHTRTFVKRGDASDWLTEQTNSLNQGDWIDPGAGKAKFKDWAEQWKATSVNRVSTRARDLSYLENHILPVFADRRLGAISHMQVRAWLAELQTKQTRRGCVLAPATVVKIFQIFAGIMATAVDARMIKVSPCDNVPLPELSHVEMRFLTAAEVHLLAEAIDPRYRVMILVACYCGLRAGELAGLRRGRIEQVPAGIRVVEQAVEVGGRVYWGAPKTAASVRTVPVNRPVMAELQEHLDLHAGDDLVFPAPQGGVLRPRQWTKRFFAPAVEEAGLAPLRPHDMRHTAVALWIAGGANLVQVKGRAGHSSVSFTIDRYGHLLPGADETLDDRLAEMFEAPEVLADNVQPLRRDHGA